MKEHERIKNLGRGSESESIQKISFTRIEVSSCLGYIYQEKIQVQSFICHVLGIDAYVL